jgi:hypothetical protein
MEPWMRGTHGELDPLRRAVVHALEQAAEDAERWCGEMTEGVLFARPAGLPSLAFQMRHAVRSLDRLLTYAEDRQLDERQLVELQTEHDDWPKTSAEDVRREFREGIALAMERVRAFRPETYPAARGIGRKRLPTTVGGLLVHCAEHTQRHIGQMVTTAKVVGHAGAEGTA